MPFRNSVSSLNKLNIQALSTCLGEVRVAPYFPSTVPYIDKVNSTTGYVGVQAWSAFTPSYSLGLERIYNKVKQSDKTPYLGFYDDTNPEAVSWEIKWMAENGIDFISNFFYRAGVHTGEVDTHVSNWLDTYLDKVDHQDDINFMLTISGETGGSKPISSSADFLNNVMPYLIERYFKNPNYVKYNNKPVIMIYSIDKIKEILGSELLVKQMLEAANNMLIAEGFAGGIFISELRPDGYGNINAAEAQMTSNMGIEYVYAYALASNETIHDNWRTQLAQYGISGIASPGVGWDSRYWSAPERYPTVFWYLNTAPEYYRFLMQVRDTHLTSYSSDSLASKMVLMDNWNEFGEGHSIAPSNFHGFGYINAVRKAFTTAPESGHSNPRPEGTFDALFTRGWKKEALRNEDFEEGPVNWNVTGGIIENSPSDLTTFEHNALRHYNRPNHTADLYQDVTNIVLNNGKGAIYDISAYIKKHTGVGHGIVYIMIKDDAGYSYHTVYGQTNSNSFTKISGAVQLTWTGKLEWARFCIRGNDSDSGDCYIDNASMKYIPW